MKTWRVSGPQFLLLYLAIFALTVVVVAVHRRRVLAARLDPHEAAYLNGGGSLAATTAVSNLLRGGFVANMARSGRWIRLATRTAPPAGAHPVEWAAYQVVRPTRSGRWGTCGPRSPSSRPWPPCASGWSRAAWSPPPSSGPGTGPPRCGSCRCWPWGRPGWRPGRPTGARSASWSSCWRSRWWSRSCSPCGCRRPPSRAGAPSSSCGWPTPGRPAAWPRPR